MAELQIEHQKVGFSVERAFTFSFEIESSLLTLFNNLFYFKVVLENLSRGEDYECPFARASIALCKMLCEVLTINSEPRKLSYLTANNINSIAHIHDDVILYQFRTEVGTEVFHGISIVCV